MFIEMLENGTGRQEMLAITGRILIMVDEKMDFLLTNNSLNESENVKTCELFTLSFILHARLSALIKAHSA